VLTLAHHSGPTSDFEFEALREARNYRAAIVREFGSFLRGSVLEVGAGIGQMTGLLRDLPTVRRLVALEPDGEFCRRLVQSLPGQATIQGTAQAISRESEWDSILSINVLEHIEADDAELACYSRLLQNRRGVLCLLVPARPEIYAPIDRDFGHFRRYTRGGLATKLLTVGFDIVRLHYFNLVGYAAWWLGFKVLRQRQFRVSSVRLFDRMIFPAAHALESRLCRPPIGQSLIAIARARRSATVRRQGPR